MDEQQEQRRKYCPKCGGETPHELTLYGERCKKCGWRRAPETAE